MMAKLSAAGILWVPAGHGFLLGWRLVFHVLLRPGNKNFFNIDSSHALCFFFMFVVIGEVHVKPML